MVSGWESANELVLGQLKVAEKSNEITAIPLLLDLLDMEGSIITIDVIGTQTDIAEKKSSIIRPITFSRQKAIKKNFWNKWKAVLSTKKTADTNELIEKRHGRIETRKCEIIPDYAIGTF